MRRKPFHLRSWGILLALCLAAGAAYVSREGLPGAQGGGFRAPARPGPSDSFLLARMPELSTQYESGIETMKERVDEWMGAVRAAGFRPMLLSDVLWRLRNGYGLPARTVVFFYSPCYRRTYEAVAPIHARHGFPAAVLTDESAMDRCDRRYLTFHALRKMRASGGWDTGFIEDGGRFRIEDERRGRSSGPIEAEWAATAGATALNRAGELRRLNYLNINADWNAAELVSRLRAESFADGKVRLSKAVIHAREWGVALDAAEEAGAFDLRAPLNKRGTKLFWLSTLGSREFRLDLGVGALRGELWLQLLYDEETGHDLRLIMSGNSVVVEEQRGRRVERLLSLSLQRPLTARPFDLNVTMEEGRLALAVDGRKAHLACRGGALPEGRGLVQLYLTDRLRGAAGAKDVRLTFTPLKAAGQR